MRRATILCLVPGVLLATAACSGEESSAPEREDRQTRATGSYDIDEKTGEISARVHQDDGSVATLRSGESVPVDLPGDFSVYPGARVIGNTRVEHGGGRGVMLTMASDDEPGKLAAFYREQAQRAGIDLDVEMDAGGTSMFAGKGPNDRTFSFNVSKESGGTVAQLMVGAGIE